MVSNQKAGHGHDTSSHRNRSDCALRLQPQPKDDDHHDRCREHENLALLFLAALQFLDPLSSSDVAGGVSFIHCGTTRITLSSAMCWMPPWSPIEVVGRQAMGFKSPVA